MCQDLIHFCVEKWRLKTVGVTSNILQVSWGCEEFWGDLQRDQDDWHFREQAGVLGITLRGGTPVGRPLCKFPPSLPPLPISTPLPFTHGHSDFSRLGLYCTVLPLTLLICLSQDKSFLGL